MKVRKRTWKNRDGKKSTSWFVDFIDAATKGRVRETLRDDSGFRNVTSERAAWEVAIKLYGRRATDPTAAALEIAPEGMTLTLDELLSQHRARVGIEATTRQIEKHQATMLTNKLGADRALSRLALQDLDWYVKQRQEDVVQKGSKKKVSGATILKELKLLNQALKWGQKRALPVRPPFVDLPTVRYEEYQARWLHMDEMPALLKACGPDTSSLRQAVEILYLTGLRRSEFFRLTWANVDFKNQRLNFLTMKGGASVTRLEDTVYLSDRAVKLLKLRLAQLDPKPDMADLIFGVPTYEVDEYETNVDPQFAYDLTAAARRAGIERPNEITPHTLRHTCATHLLQQGAKIPEVAKHLRHRDGGALLMKKYAHVHEEGLRAASASLSVELPKIVNNTKSLKAQKGTKGNTRRRKSA